MFRQWLPHRLPVFRHLIWNVGFFALLHISVVNTLPDMTLRFVEIFVAGGFLFLARKYTNNLLFTIVLHALLNLTMGLLLYISAG